MKAPEHPRGGLIFEGRFEIHAKVRLGQPRLVLGPGWTEGMTVNTMIPQPKAERSDGGVLTYVFDPIPAGERFTFWTQYQVNPSTSAAAPRDATLYDGPRRLAAVHREVTIFP